MKKNVDQRYIKALYKKVEYGKKEAYR